MTDSVRMQLLEERMTYGVGAYIVEPYDSANIKRGLQFYVRVNYPLADKIDIGDANARYILYKTTSKRSIPKSRIVQYEGEEFKFEIFENPIVNLTGLTKQKIGNYNLENPQPETVEVYKVPLANITDVGTLTNEEPEYYFGGAQQQQRDAQSIPTSAEKVVPPNKELLIKITNNSQTSAGRFKYFLDWYEGDPESFD